MAVTFTRANYLVQSSVITSNVSTGFSGFSTMRKRTTQTRINRTVRGLYECNVRLKLPSPNNPIINNGVEEIMCFGFDRHTVDSSQVRLVGNPDNRCEYRDAS